MKDEKKFSGLGELAQRYERLEQKERILTDILAKSADSVKKLTQIAEQLEYKYQREAAGVQEPNPLDFGFPQKLRFQPATINLVSDTVLTKIQTILFYNTRRVRLKKLRYVVSNIDKYRVVVSTEKSTLRLYPVLWTEDLVITTDPDTGSVRYCFEQDYGTFGVFADESLSVSLEIAPRPTPIMISGLIIAFYEE